MSSFSMVIRWLRKFIGDGAFQGFFKKLKCCEQSAKIAYKKLIGLLRLGMLLQTYTSLKYLSLIKNSLAFII
mgnify:CR=1 FL=1